MKLLFSILAGLVPLFAAKADDTPVTLNSLYTTTSRLQLLDGIPLRNSLKMDMEVWHWADTQVGYAAGTFWYARPGAISNRGAAAEDASQGLIH